MAELNKIIEGVATNYSFVEAFEILKLLSFFILGMAIYSFFIFKFYRFVARREIFEFKISKFNYSENQGIKKFLYSTFYVIKYVIIFPIITFFWFFVLAIIMTFLSKQGNIQDVLLISVALIGTIRIMSYYNEDLSKDLAKMLPFALLGIFLVDISYFSLNNSLTSIMHFFGFWKLITYYLFFIVILEFTLRIFYGVAHLISSKPISSKDNID